jgi:hypothetical protein
MSEPSLFQIFAQQIGLVLQLQWTMRITSGQAGMRSAEQFGLPQHPYGTPIAISHPAPSNPAQRANVRAERAFPQPRTQPIRALGQDWVANKTTGAKEQGMPHVNLSHTTSRQATPPQGYAPYAPPGPNSGPNPSHTELADLRAALNEVTHGLQLSRASTLSLMRLQLAMRSGDRAQALEAVDRLDTLDAELERIVARLSPPDDGDETLHAIAKHLEAQKLALAFEKLALASGIVGPDLVSIEHAWPHREPAPGPEQWEPSGELPAMPDLSALRPPQDEYEFEPQRRRGIPPLVWGLVLMLLLAAAIAGALMLGLVNLPL